MFEPWWLELVEPAFVEMSNVVHDCKVVSGGNKHTDFKNNTPYFQDIFCVRSNVLVGMQNTCFVRPATTSSSSSSSSVSDSESDSQNGFYHSDFELRSLKLNEETSKVRFDELHLID